MTTRAFEEQNEALASLVDLILRRPWDQVRVEALAAHAGYSRSHLVRLFHRATGESLREFVKRIRMEKAAYSLAHSDDSVRDVAFDCGYGSLESFSRAFRSVHGDCPTVWKGHGKPWIICSRENLHWNPDWSTREEHRPTWGITIKLLPERHALVYRWMGSYSDLSQGWLELAAAVPNVPQGVEFVTIYLDNLWTHPVRDGMRADIGWLCEPDAVAPEQMRKVTLAGGAYAVSRVIRRSERNAAWSQLSGQYTSEASVRSGRMSFDTYPEWPLPFEEVKTVIHIGIGRQRP